MSGSHPHFIITPHTISLIINAKIPKHRKDAGLFFRQRHLCVCFFVLCKRHRFNKVPGAHHGDCCCLLLQDLCESFARGGQVNDSNEADTQTLRAGKRQTTRMGATPLQYPMNANNSSESPSSSMLKSNTPAGWSALGPPRRPAALQMVEDA